MARQALYNQTGVNCSEKGLQDVTKCVLSRSKSQIFNRSPSLSNPSHPLSSMEAALLYGSSLDIRFGRNSRPQDVVSRTALFRAVRVLSDALRKKPEIF